MRENKTNKKTMERLEKAHVGVYVALGDENDGGGSCTLASTAVVRGSLSKFGIIHYEGPNRGRRTSTPISRSRPNDATIMDD